MATAFVFDPTGNYQLVQDIREAGIMPAAGLRYVASISGPYKVFQVVDYDALDQLGGRLDSTPGGSPTTLAMGTGKVRRSTYLAHTALVRIDVRAAEADPAMLLPQIKAAIDSDSDDEVEAEADVVLGDFDILACVVADDEESLATKIRDIRRIPGVKRTVSLRVLDYVSTSENAPDDHKVSALD